MKQVQKKMRKAPMLEQMTRHVGRAQRLPPELTLNLLMPALE